MKVPLLDLKGQYYSIKNEVLAVTNEIYESQYFILGPKVAELEERIAAYCNTRFAVGVSSGTDALLLSLMAADVGTGDIVISTPYTFFATTGSITRVGAKPLFVDIDPATFNISPVLLEDTLQNLSEEERLRVKAIMPVHLYGQCADMDPIMKIAGKYDISVIEDAAQAIGSEYQGARAGSIGDMGCFSFFPSKNLGAFGDGGIVTTNNEKLFKRLSIMRVHGSSPKYYHKLIGGNFRLDALQAAIVNVKLNHLDGWTRKRQANAETYRMLFGDVRLQEVLSLPEERENRHIYNQFVITLKKKRDQLKDYLGEQGIVTEIYYPVPMHLQECFSFLRHKKGDFPESEYAADHTLALPIYPELTLEQMEYVVEKIKAFYIQ